ncbi:MAG TPA: hypothetical protein VFZ48_03720 [Candidatus Saccharimonadales bacterium]
MGRSKGSTGRETDQAEEPRLVLIRRSEVRRQEGDRSAPLKDKSGTLEIVLALEGLTLRSSSVGAVEYPDGPGFTYTQGCEVFLEVFPRGYDQRQYEQWQRGIHTPTHPIRGVRQTPMVISQAAKPWLSGVMRGATCQHTTVLPYDQKMLEKYLGANLPQLGVVSGDAKLVIAHIKKLLSEGEEEIVSVAQLHAERHFQ